MQRLNPTGSLLRARPFVARHDYIFTLLCLLNVNMGALNTSALLVGNGELARGVGGREGEGASEGGETPMDLSLEMVLAQGLLDDMAGVFKEVKHSVRAPERGSWGRYGALFSAIFHVDRQTFRSHNERCCLMQTLTLREVRACGHDCAVTNRREVIWAVYMYRADPPLVLLPCIQPPNV